jgi:hypothetical protein
MTSKSADAAYGTTLSNFLGFSLAFPWLFQPLDRYGCVTVCVCYTPASSYTRPIKTYTGKAVRSVKDCLMFCLTDKNPLDERASVLEA